MSLIDDLARQKCEQNTGKDGCASPSNRDHPRDEWCHPCLARAELGVAEPDRLCEDCGQVMVRFDFAGGISTGSDANGSQTCPPKLHRPHLYYEELTARSITREHPTHKYEWEPARCLICTPWKP